jgi:hypothetical protein
MITNRMFGDLDGGDVGVVVGVEVAGGAGVDVA